jgi:hypothetical protein
MLLLYQINTAMYLLSIPGWWRSVVNDSNCICICIRYTTLITLHPLLQQQSPHHTLLTLSLDSAYDVKMTLYANSQTELWPASSTGTALAAWHSHYPSQHIHHKFNIMLNRQTALLITLCYAICIECSTSLSHCATHQLRLLQASLLRFSSRSQQALQRRNAQ